MSSDFEAYLERYAKQYDLTIEDALSHKIVQEVKSYYENLEGGVACEP